MCLVDMVQHMGRTVEILQELGWTVLVLIPKGTADTQGICLLDTLCKVVETLIDTRLPPYCRFTMSSMDSGPEEGQGWL